MRRPSLQTKRLRFGASSPRLLSLAIAVLALALSAVAPVSAQDQSGVRDDGLVRLDQIDGGGRLLYFTDEPGLYVPAPLLATKIDVSVSGPVARTTVQQGFTNPSDVFVEGKYVFPLPEGAAVDTLWLQIGDRWIKGEIKERQEAREIYEEAKAEGRKASLVEQERPNLFTTSVANIGPNETVRVLIAYQETLAPRDGVFGLRIPLVVAPRYTPEARIQSVKFGPNGWEIDASDPVPDREAITPPVADPRLDDPATLRNPVELCVDIDAGFPLGPIESLYHAVNVAPRGAAAARVALSGPAPADRDFYLSWRPQRLPTPYMALFGETTEDEAHYVVMLTPPAADEIGDTRKPREVIFVQDISGSMFGESIEQARKGLEMAVKRLSPEDTFNIIVFNDRFGLFADAPIPATEANVARAVASIQALQADGGTEMLPALEAALKDGRQEEDRVRQVIFLTDGAVGNERERLRLSERDLGRSRLFTVGSGSAPNSYFMTAAAEAGRGTHVFIGDLSEVQERMEALFRKIETPAMTDLTLRVDGFNAAETWPNPLPDLYAGDPVVATIRVDTTLPTRAIPAIEIEGVRAGEDWRQKLLLADAEPRDGVSKLWARQRIKSLEALRLSPEVGPEGAEAIDAEILKTALDNHLVSRLTSLVAVDVEISRDQNEELVTRDVPLNLPKGWAPEAFFDGFAPELGPQDAQIDDASFVRRAAAAHAREDAAAEAAARGVPVPATAAGWALQALLGVILVLVAAFWALSGRLFGRLADRRRAA
ncbi:MAG: marine proteobacterial sortase target protein [Neomegalonema sp.]